MNEAMRCDIGEAVSGERALDAVRAIARFHRIQATPGYAAAAAWLAGELRHAGLAPRVEHARGDGRTRHLGILMPQGWRCDRATADLADGPARERITDWEQEPLSLIQRSGPASGRYPVIDVGAGTEAGDYAGRDVRGRVVLASGAVHRVHALAVIERGAAGILACGRRLFPPVRDADHDPASLSYTSFWWNEDAPRGWGVVATPACAARIRRRLAEGAALSLEVEIVTEAFDARIPLVECVIGEPTGGPGSEVLLLAHLCHPRPGANDNASGAAAALEAARALDALRRRGAWSPSRRAVRVLWMPEFTGTAAWLGLDRQRAGRLAAALNLDMVGEDQCACGSVFLLERPPAFCASFAETLLARVRRAMADPSPGYAGPAPHAATRMAETGYSGGSDHAVLLDPAANVPCPMLIQWPDRWYHTSYDTPDRCDPRSLAHAARTAAGWAATLAAAGVDEVVALAREVRLEAVARRAAAEAAGAPERARRRAAEAMRARAALASLARLGLPPAAIEVERAALDAAVGALVAAGEEGTAEDVGARRSPRVPVRLLDGPLEMLRHLLPGWHRLSAAEREAWHVAERDAPGGALPFEIAWLACDGARDLEAITTCVWLETGARMPARDDGTPGSIEAFFGRTAALGLSAWREDAYP
jgi:hypothetical protein